MIIKPTRRGSNVKPKVKESNKVSPETVVEPKYKIVEEKPNIIEKEPIIAEEDLILFDSIEEN